MRVLVHLTDLVRGGSVLNAVDLAAVLQERGHEILVASPRGPLYDHVAARGLQHAVTPFTDGLRPHRSGSTALRSVVRHFSPQVVHTWEFGAYLNAFFGARMPRVPQLATVMSMDFPRHMPRSVPVTMGTRALVSQVAAQHRAPVSLLEPPIDLASETAGVDQQRALRQRFGLRQDGMTVVIVSRLATEMKAEGILDCVTAVGRLAGTWPVQLLVVGDGEARRGLEAAACAVEEEIGRRVVVFTGAMADPRPAYALADVVVGMGSSALRGMAFGKPVVVVGTGGFTREVTPRTFPHFDREGMWGVGQGTPQPDLADLIETLLGDGELRASLGAWGREVIRLRYDLQAVASALEAALVGAVEEQAGALTDAREALLTVAKTAPPAFRAPYVVPRAMLRRLRPA